MFVKISETKTIKNEMVGKFKEQIILDGIEVIRINEYNFNANL